MSPWLLIYIYMDAVMKDVKMGIGRREEKGDYIASDGEPILFPVHKE